MLFTEDILNEKETKGSKMKALSEEKESSSMWTLYFDGICSSSGSGAGVVLIPPEGEPEPIAFKLEFGNTNNTAEYEALLLGIVATK